MNTNIDRGFKLCLKAKIKANEELLYQRWLHEKQNLKDKYKYDFESYKKLFIRKKVDKNKLEKDKKRIDRQTERIKMKFSQKR